MAASQEEEHKCVHNKHLIFSYTSPLVKGEIIKRPSQYCKTPYVADVITKEKRRYQRQWRTHQHLDVVVSPTRMRMYT